ncbi:MAG TPA: hypothetical protein VGU67_02790 [Edaphobacter sp.]|nr:hypothetical protein [Edaphobacter sp.]
MAAQPQILSPGEYEEDEQEIISTGALTAYEEAERTSQVAIAKKYPRSLTIFRKELSEIARMNQPVAMEMMYSVPRAGKQLIGPSVRFAEAVLSAWGNCHAAVRIKDVAGDFIIAESAFYDAEKNARLTVEVKRRITDKQGKRFNADMIGVTGAAASSIALRGAILRGVPKALWADLFEQAKKTAAGDVASMEKTRSEMVAVFRALGVTDAMLMNALNVQGMADVGTDEIVAMTAWHKQLVSKECTLEDIFGSTDDAEIEQTMEALNWNEAQKTMARTNYKGRRSELLEYVRGLAKTANEATGAKPVAVKAATPRASAPKETDTAAKESATATTENTTGTTAAASTSPESSPAKTTVAKEDW